MRALPHACESVVERCELLTALDEAQAFRGHPLATTAPPTHDGGGSLGRAALVTGDRHPLSRDTALPIYAPAEFLRTGAVY